MWDMEGEIPFLRVLTSKFWTKKDLTKQVVFVFKFRENILTVSQPNGMTSIHFHQCKKWSFLGDSCEETQFTSFNRQQKNEQSKYKNHGSLVGNMHMQKTPAF